MTATTPTAPATLSRDDRYELAITAYRRFAELAATVDERQWALPTDCELWNVRDLVGHVVGAMRSSASMRENMSQMREIKRRVKRDGGQMVDVMTQVQIERAADLGPAELVSECASLCEPATTGRRRTPAPMRKFVKIHVEMGPIQETWTLGYLVDTILTRDAWLHRVDLARAIGVDPVLTPDHDGRLVADVAEEWMRRHGQPCRLTLTGPAGGTFVSGEDGEELELDAVEFCRITSGRAEGHGLLATAVPF